MKNNRLVRLVMMAMLAAIAVVLMIFIHIPYPPVPFLKYDMADVPVLLGTMLYGIWPGLIILLITSVIQAFMVSADGWIGLTMHFVASGVLLVLVGVFHKKDSPWSKTILGMVLGTLAMTLVMIEMNLILTPLFLNVPRQDVIALLLPGIIPFNLLKAGGNCLITGIVFKALTPFIRRNPQIIPPK